MIIDRNICNNKGLSGLYYFMNTKSFKTKIIFSILLFVLAFSFGLMWASIVPPDNEAPDEASHVNMVYFLKEEKRIPVFNHEKEIKPTRYDSRILSGAYYSMAYNSPLSYLPFISLARSPTENFSKSNVLPMRVISVLFIALFGVFLFLALSNFQPQNPTLAAAVSLFAVLIPQVIFTAGYVNIEPIALLISAISFYFLSRIVTAKDKRLGNFIGLGLALSLLGLTKANYLIFVVFSFLVLIINIVKSEKRRRPTIYSLISAGIFVIFNLWWWIRNIALYGDPLIIGYIQREIVDKAPEWVLSPAKLGYNIITIFERKDFLKFTFFGFFANLGGASIFLPLAFYIIFFLMIITCLYLVFKNIKQNRYSEFVWSTIAVSLAAILYFANKNLHDFSPQGRHLFPLLIPLIAVIYLGLANLSKIWQKIISLFLIMFGVISSLWGLWLTVDQYYVRGVAYSNVSNSGKIVTVFSWRPIDFSKYNNLLNYIVKDNPIIFQNVMLVTLAFIFLLSLMLIIYFIIHTQDQSGSSD